MVFAVTMVFCHKMMGSSELPSLLSAVDVFSQAKFTFKTGIIGRIRQEYEPGFLTPYKQPRLLVETRFINAGRAI